MTICASDTIPKSMVARIGNTVSAVRIARPDPRVRRVRWVRGDRQGLKVFLESEVRWVRKVPKVWLVPLVPRVLSAKQDLWGHKDLPVLLGLPVRKALPALPGQLAHKVLPVKSVSLVPGVLPALQDPPGPKVLRVLQGQLVLKDLQVKQVL